MFPLTHILAIDHSHYALHLYSPNLMFLLKYQKRNPSFPQKLLHPHLASQCSIGIKILTYQTSVRPSRHWVGVVHDNKDVISIWEGEGWTRLGSSSFRLGPLPSFWVLQFLVLSHCLSAHHTLCIFCYSFYIISFFFFCLFFVFSFHEAMRTSPFGGGYMHNVHKKIINHQIW